jgi:hypothetical protein
MIVKPSISWLTTDSDVQLVNDTNVILLGMGDNVAIYPTPLPNLLTVAEAMGDFSSALAAAADGGPSATANKNNKRGILVGYLRQLGSYVGVACQGDMTKLLLSGFPAQKPVRTPVGTLPAPQNLTVTHGALTGNLKLDVHGGHAQCRAVDRPEHGGELHLCGVDAGGDLHHHGQCRWCGGAKQLEPVGQPHGHLMDVPKNPAPPERVVGSGGFWFAR